MDKPSRFTATPAQIHAFLLENFAEDALLAYQQEIGASAITEAVADVQTVRAQADNEGLYNADWREGWDDFFDRINPEQNGPAPSALVRPAGGGDSEAVEVVARFSNSHTMRLQDFQVSTLPGKLHVMGRLVSGTAWPLQGKAVHLDYLGIPGRGALADIATGINLFSEAGATYVRIEVSLDAVR